MISSVVSDRTVVIAPSLRHVKALHDVIYEHLPAEIVQFNKGDDWNAQPDDMIIYIQVENPLVQVGRSSYTPATSAIEEFITVADFLSCKQAFIVTDEVAITLIDHDGYRYGNKILGVKSIQRLKHVPNYLAKPEGV